MSQYFYNKNIERFENLNFISGSSKLQFFETSEGDKHQTLDTHLFFPRPYIIVFIAYRDKGKA